MLHFSWGYISPPLQAHITILYIVYTLLVSSLLFLPGSWRILGTSCRDHLNPSTIPLICKLRITIGYHRLYSHRAFRASTPVRVVLAALGSAGFQGSIKVRTCRVSPLITIPTRAYSGGVCDIASIMYVLRNK